MKPFGDPNPWAEPAWYNALDSPYYRESHRKLRAYIREYMESNVIPYADEWEESGHVPLEVSNRCIAILANSHASSAED